MPKVNIYDMSFVKVYELLIAKVLRKNRTKEEVYTVTSWLTGYSSDDIDKCMTSDISYGDFFLNAPCLNENRVKITGTICGVRIEEIEEPLMKEIRYLDKLVDELTKGKSMDKILRK